mmetsp:Transcript_6898/g.13737  ORF Transcript_6898/g.13737 Transcript_6898/m.13737 type:complete len:488 (+) Transcript_6898:34-1497(+)
MENNAIVALTNDPDDGLVTKRLSFGEMSQQLNDMQQINPDEVIQALKNPAADNFARALEKMREDCRVRRATIEETAKEQSVSVGEADLRRMKRQFSSLKNTFLHYEVKDEFIAALADGLPNGTEDIQLQQFDEEAERNIALLRDWKAKNAEKQEDIGKLIDELEEMMGKVDEETAKTLDDLVELSKEMRAFDAEMGQMAVDIEPGMDEEECKRVIEEESAKADELEARLLASMTELKSMEGGVPGMRHDLEVARETLEDMKAQHASVGNQNANHKESRRYSSSSAWATETVEMLQAVSGISNVHITQGNMLTCRLQTVYPVRSVIGVQTLRDFESVEHTIELEMSTSNGHVVQGAMAPADVDVADVVHEIRQSHRQPIIEHVLGAIRSKVSGYYHRRALLKHAQETFPDAVPHDDGMHEITCPLVRQTPAAESLRARVRLIGSWPEQDDCAQVISLDGQCDIVTDDIFAKRFDGFVSALESIQAMIQ